MTRPEILKTLLAEVEAEYLAQEKHVRESSHYPNKAWWMSFEHCGWVLHVLRKAVDGKYLLDKEQELVERMVRDRMRRGMR
jgi:hypothetical protein